MVCYFAINWVISLSRRGAKTQSKSRSVAVTQPDGIYNPVRNVLEFGRQGRTHKT